jgi:hypothetical protein
LLQGRHHAFGCDKPVLIVDGKCAKVGFQSHNRAISVDVKGELFSGDIYQILEEVRNIQHSIFLFSISILALTTS